MQRLLVSNTILIMQKLDSFFNLQSRLKTQFTFFQDMSQYDQARCNGNSPFLRGPVSPTPDNMLQKIVYNVCNDVNSLLQH